MQYLQYNFILYAQIVDNILNSIDQSELEAYTDPCIYCANKLSFFLFILLMKIWSHLVFADSTENIQFSNDF